MSILKKSLGGDRRLGDVGGNARPTFGISNRSCHEKGLRRALPRRRSPSSHRPRKPESRWRISQYLILRCAPKAFFEPAAEINAERHRLSRETRREGLRQTSPSCSKL